MDSTDVVVIGAGPAGSAAAQLLARWGHSVVLIAGPARRAQNIAESLPPSIRKLLIIVGLADCVESAGFVRSEGNTSWWGTNEPRIETFPGPPEQHGYQVQRSHFDRVLLDSVAATGVDVRPGRVRRVDVQASAGARVEYVDRGTPRVTAAQLVLDCSGRAGVIGRHELRRSEPGHETIALTAAWRRNKPWDGFAPSHTLVETFDDGWAWSIPVSPSIRYVTVMVDKDRLRQGSGESRRSAASRAEAEPKRHDPGAGSTAQDAAYVLGLAGRYRAELAKTNVLARLVEHACPCGTVSACDASLYSSRRYADSQFLLVGDAGSFIDPLSSYGIKKALASAWLAAVAAHTAIKHPGLRSTALDFFEQRERQVYSSYLAQAVHYFRDAAERHSHPFWQRRGASTVEEQSWVFNEEILRQDRDVLRGFDWLRRSASIQLRPNAGVTCENRPAVVENEIVLAATAVGPGIPAGARFLGGVHLPSLLSMAGERGQVPELFELYNRRHPPVSLPDFLGALSVLIGKGILVNHGDESMKA